MAHRVKLGKQGRLVIPADLRRELELKEGDEVSMHADGGQLVVETPAAALRRLKGMFADLPPGVSMADELIAERRVEALREEQEFFDEEQKFLDSES